MKHIVKRIKALSASVLALVLLLTLTGLPVSVLAEDGREMVAEGSAGDKITIQDVKLLDEDGGEIQEIHIGGSDMENYTYTLQFTFNTDAADVLGGQTVILNAPFAVEVLGVTTPLPFMIDGQKKGTYTTDATKNQIIITLDENVHDLQQGIFNLEVHSSYNKLVEHIDKEITVGGHKYTVRQKAAEAPPYSKNGDTNGTDADLGLADNQISWWVYFNPKAKVLTEDLTVTDEVVQLEGGAKIDYDFLGSQDAPKELTVYELVNTEAGPQFSPTEHKVTLNPDGTGFTKTFTKEEASGHTFMVNYRITITGADAETTLYAPNYIEVKASKDFDAVHEYHTVGNDSSGSATASKMGTFQENHFFFASRENYEKYLETQDPKLLVSSEAKDVQRQFQGVPIKSYAHSDEALEAKNYTFVASNSPADNQVTFAEDGRSVVDSKFEAGKHKIANYYYVQKVEEPKRGAFVENHYYFDNEDEMDELTKATSKDEAAKDSTGTTEEKFTTAPKAKENYVLKKVEVKAEGLTDQSEQETTLSLTPESGSVEHNYEADKKIVVNYVYVLEKPEPPVEEKVGHFIENHYYFDSEEDLEQGPTKAASKDEEHQNLTGKKDETFTTVEQPKEGYSLKKVVTKVKATEGEATTDLAPSTEGEAVTHNFEENKTITVSYYYLKDAPEQGAFVENHYYFDDVADVADLTKATSKELEHKKSEGTAEEEFKTAPLPKDNYVLQSVEVKAEKLDDQTADTTELKVDKDSGEVTYNYEVGKKIIVNYVYVLEKTEPPVVEKEGHFIENHYYFDSEEALENGPESAASKDEEYQKLTGKKEETYTTEA